MKAKILIILRYAIKAVKALIYIISGGHICGCQGGNSDSGSGCCHSATPDSGTGCSQSGNSDSGEGCSQSGESDSEAVSNQSDGGVSHEAEKTGAESGEK